MRGGAYVIQPHGVLSPCAVRLEEYCFFVPALLTGVIFCPGQSWVLGNVRNDLCQFIHFMGDLIDVDAAVVGLLLVIAVSTLGKETEREIKCTLEWGYPIGSCYRSKLCSGSLI